MQALLLVGAVLLISVSFFGTGRRRDGRAVECMGSTSVQPFAEILAQEFERLPGGIRVDVEGGGSTAGIVAIDENIADIGMCSRGLKPDEARQFVGIPIALDGLAAVVHKSNPITGLTREQIRRIFCGDVSNWQEVGGDNRPIHLITREEGSGTREAFVKLVMEAHGPDETIGRISPRAMAQESNGAVRELVRHDRGAIGYMSLGLVNGELRILEVDGVYPTVQEVVNKRYPLVRPFLFVTKGVPPPDAQAFIDYVLSPAGQQLLQKEGLVGVR